MKPENLKFLQDQLFYTGFGHELDKKLESAMKKGKEEFSLDAKASYTSLGVSKPIDFKLNFRKGNDDMFFFNNYDAKLGDKQMRVYVNAGEKNITSKESFNLLEGRAVYKELTPKEGEKYNAWMQIKPESIDEGKVKFNIYNDKYGFNPKAALKEVAKNGYYASYAMDNAIADLKKGNLIEIHSADKSEKIFLAANPKERNFNALSPDGATIDLSKNNKEIKTEKVGISI